MKRIEEIDFLKFKEEFDENDVSWTDHELEMEKRRDKMFERQVKREIKRGRDKQRKHELEYVRHVYDVSSEEDISVDGEKKKEGLTTTKKLLLFILLNCAAVEVYSMWVMVYLSDISGLYSLISAVVGTAFTFAVYAWKSYNETREQKNNELQEKGFHMSVDDLEIEEPDDPEEPEDPDIPNPEDEIGSL